MYNRKRKCCYTLIFQLVTQFRIYLHLEKEKCETKHNLVLSLLKTKMDGNKRPHCTVENSNNISIWYFLWFFVLAIVAFTFYRTIKKKISVLKTQLRYSPGFEPRSSSSYVQILHAMLVYINLKKLILPCFTP